MEVKTNIGGVSLGEIIRTVCADEADDIDTLIESCYGIHIPLWANLIRERCSMKGIFMGPERENEEHLQYSLVMEKEGELVSHIGMFPIVLSLGSARIICGGIGAVGTVPEERNKGYMSKLMKASIQRMRERKWPLSGLGGDRQRYSHFGYERCGLRYRLRINERSLNNFNCHNTELEEVDPENDKVLNRILSYYNSLDNRVERWHLKLLLNRADRIFIGPEGYVICSKNKKSLNIWEVVSSTDQEIALINAVLKQSSQSSATVEVGPGERGKISRLLQASTNWSIASQWMFRIIYWPSLLKSLKPFLYKLTQGMPPFEISIGCSWNKNTDWATFEWDGNVINIADGRLSDNSVKIDERKLVGSILGGPFNISRKRLGDFGKLLPIPIYVPLLEHI